MSDPEINPQPEPPGMPENIWLRGLIVIVIAILVEFAKTVLWIAAVIQFFWMLFGKTRNHRIASFGEDLGKWFQTAVRFQTGQSDEKPFPWAEWR